MKRIKTLCAMLLITALAFSFGVCGTASADGGRITISNALPGNTYKVYKVFDAAYAGDSVNYVIDTTTGETGEPEKKAALVEAIQEGDESCPFTLLPGSTGIYWIQIKNETVTAARISAWLKEQMDYLTIAASKNATGDVLEFDNIVSGYYLVTSGAGDTPGGVFSLDSATPDMTIIDKNVRRPSQVDKSTAEIAAEIGEEVPFTSSFFAVNFRVNESMDSRRIMQYVLTDTNVKGLDYLSGDETSVFGDPAGTIELYTKKNDDGSFTNSNKLEVGGSTAYKAIEHTYDSSTHKLTITWADDENTSRYPSNVWVVMKYKMKMNDGVYVADGDNYKFIDAENKIEADMKLCGVDALESIGEDTEKVKSTGISVTKVDDKNTTKNLTGAKFILSKGTDEYKLYWKADPENNTITWVNKESDAQVCEADNNEFTAEFYGLEPGSYYLREVAPPAGYILSPAEKTVYIEYFPELGEFGAAVSEGGTPSSVKINENGIFDITITNIAGRKMPGTGGIGTTVFYALGGVLFLAGAALLIVKKRGER